MTTDVCVVTPASFSALQRAENSSITNRTVRCASHAALSVLFSEPKIPQSRLGTSAPDAARAFQCSSASRKFLNDAGLFAARGRSVFQCSSASRKFLNPPAPAAAAPAPRFQCSSASRKFLNTDRLHRSPRRRKAFSALQRAENSSIRFVKRLAAFSEPFSALQRAENSSISPGSYSTAQIVFFQCSSASRKFLNWVATR